MPQPRKMPSRSTIYTYWYDRLLKKGIEIGDQDTCFACGYHIFIERAHITAKCDGGSDDVTNLHLLCRICHTKTEFLSGKVYWTWLRNTNQEDYKLSIQHVYDTMVKTGYSHEKYEKIIQTKGNRAAIEYHCSFRIWRTPEHKEGFINKLLLSIKSFPAFSG